MTKDRLTIEIDEETKRKFKLLAAIEGETMKALLEQMIDDRLSKNKTKLDSLK